MNDFALSRLRQLLVKPRTISELLEVTKLPERTLRYKLSILRKSGELVELPDFSDLRSKKLMVKQNVA